MKSIGSAGVSPAFLLIFACAVCASAQPGGAHIGYVFPAGGKQGTTFEVTVGGQFLDGVNRVHISGKGATATITEYIKPITQGQAVLLRDQLMQLLEKKRLANGGKPGPETPKPFVRPTWRDADEKSLNEIRKKLSTFVRNPSSPAIVETVTMQVTLAPDAEPTDRELRLIMPNGVSNPMRFCVSQLNEFLESNSKSSSTENQMTVTLPAIVNGRIMPGDIDRVKFKATKGQRIVAVAAARDLIPYIADAVPGWFQATLALYDSKGSEVAYADDFRFNPDPVLAYEIPADGEYSIEVKDAIFRGREDFVYRISIGELPYITGIFPLGGKVGTKADVELMGWNLPVSKLSVDCKAPGIIPINVAKGALVSNSLPFSVDALPELNEKEPNDLQSTAQPIALPAMINGRIDKRGNWDIYRVEGRAGMEIVAEVHARRLDSPIDAVLKLTDAAGKQIAFNDDHDDKGAGLTTHHADAYLKATLPATGPFFIWIGDEQNGGGPEYTYRLRISAPRPDFELRVGTASLSMRAGSAVPVTVYALRKDGFMGEISLATLGMPTGFTLSGGRIAANQDQVRLTVTAPPGLSREEPLSLRIEGTARIAGKDVTHPAVASEDMMQAFAYRHLVPAQELDLVMAERQFTNNRLAAAMKEMPRTPLRIPSGGTAVLHLPIQAQGFFGKQVFELDQAPEGITIRNASGTRDGTDLLIACDAKVKPGTKGNLIISLFPSQKTPAGNAKPNITKRRMPVATLPAVEFDVVFGSTGVR